jgi:hypothetical protein
VQCYGRSEARRLFEHLLEKPPSNAIPARIGDQRDVQHAHILRRVVHVETPDGPAVEQDDEKRRVGVVPAIVCPLKIELHAQEGVCLRRGPSNVRELVHARAGVQVPEERLVSVLFRTKEEAIDQRRVQRSTRYQLWDGNTPTSAMQKFNARCGCMF